MKFPNARNVSPKYTIRRRFKLLQQPRRNVRRAKSVFQVCTRPECIGQLRAFPIRDVRRFCPPNEKMISSLTTDRTSSFYFTFLRRVIGTRHTPSSIIDDYSIEKNAIVIFILSFSLFLLNNRYVELFLTRNCEIRCSVNFHDELRNLIEKNKYRKRTMRNVQKTFCFRGAQFAAQ